MMQFIQKLSLLIVPLFVAANAAATKTASEPAATQSVQVGAVAFSFTPSTVTANVGDIIEFRFYPQNHSVARADFKNPCIPYEVTGPGRVGFWSGFKPVALVLSDPPTFRLRINDTNPIFFYCAAPGACETEGMIGVINPNATQTFAIQQAYTRNATTAFAPGEYFPPEVASSSTKTSAPTSSATSNVIPINTNNGSSKISTGEIIGIVLGALAVLIIFAAVVYICGRQKAMGEMLRHSQFGSLHYGGQTPVTPSAAGGTFFHGSPQNLEADVFGRRLSQARPHDRITFSSEFHRSGSPTSVEARENMDGSIHGSVHGSLKNGSLSPSQVESPLMGRPPPRYPVQITGNPVPLRVSVLDGPHEIMSSSDRDHVPNQGPVLKEKASLSENIA